MERPNLEMKADASFEDIVSSVKAHGACVIPGFLDQDAVAELEVEFDKIVDTDVDVVRTHADYGYVRARAARLQDLAESEFPAVKRYVGSDWLASLARQYHDDIVDYPSKLFFARSIGTDAPVDEGVYLLHYDKHNFLKFAILLTDVTEDDGPTWVAVGRREEFRQRRLGSIRQGTIKTDDNSVVIDTAETPLVGPAGSLVIFDTDTPHRAGQIAPGRKRKMLRIDTEGRRNAELYNPPKRSSTIRRLLRAVIR